MIQISKTLELDLARKCAKDVSAVINRNVQLCPSQASGITVVIAGALQALTSMGIALDVMSGIPPGTTTVEEVVAVLTRRSQAERTEVSHG